MRQDWIECTLDEICEKALKVKRKEMPLSEHIKYLDIGGIDNHSNKIISHKHYTWEDAPSRAQQIIKKDDVLFSTVRTYLKNIAKVNKEEYNDEIASSGFTILRAKKEILNSDYLFFRSLSTVFLNSLNKLQRGTSYPAVRDKDVFAQIIPLPPLVEQKAIVKKIEELFSSLDSGIADLKKAQDQLVIYRQAVLKKAFEGELSQISKLKWTVTKLGKLIVEGPTNGLYKPQSFYGKGVLIIRIDSFYEGKINPWNSLKRLELNEKELSAYTLSNGDIVINRVNSMPFVGKSALIENLNEDCVFESNIMRLKVDDSIINPKYLVRYLSSTVGYSELQKNVKHAVNQSSINQTDVKNVILKFPDLEEQQSILKEIESRLSVCDKVEESIKESLEKAQALRQSILKKAFEGTLLTEVEIAKCKSDNDYEPASVLLERIKMDKIKK